MNKSLETVVQGPVDHILGHQGSAAQHQLLVIFAIGHQGCRVHGVVGAFKGRLDGGRVFEVGTDPFYLVPAGCEALKLPAAAGGFEGCRRAVQPAYRAHSSLD